MKTIQHPRNAAVTAGALLGLLALVVSSAQGFSGFGVSAPFHLDTRTGACCTSTGSCTITFPDACQTPDLWQGGGTTCEPNPCLISSASGGERNLALAVQASPSPSSGDVRIQYQVPKPTMVVVRIFDTAGRLIRELVNESRPAGVYSLLWDGRDDAGQALRSGVYWTRLETAEGRVVGKVILAK